MAKEQPIASFAIPVHRGAIFGTSFFTLFLLSFVALGVYNLFHGIALIASSLWLSLMGFLVGGFCKERGTRRVLTDALGAFVRKQYAWAFRVGAGQIEIRFGYELFGRRRFYLRIPMERVESVNWNTGIGSYCSKRDIGDWHVALWYDHGDPEKSRRERRWSRKPDQEIYIFGLDRPKEITAAFGHSFLDFLRESGVTLVPGKDDCTFVREPTQNVPMPANPPLPQT